MLDYMKLAIPEVDFNDGRISADAGLPSPALACTVGGSDQLDWSKEKQSPHARLLQHLLTQSQITALCL